MGKKLYVGNLSYTTSEDQLREFFASAGEVTSATVITDRDTGRSKGFGFVEMSTEAAAQGAIESLNGHSLDGRNVTVAEARPPRTDRGGGGGRDRDRGGRDRW